MAYVAKIIVFPEINNFQKQIEDFWSDFLTKKNWAFIVKNKVFSIRDFEFFYKYIGILFTKS